MILDYAGETEEITTLPPVIKEILFEQELQLDIPKFHVILYDDKDHTYDYVIEMLMNVFGYSSSVAFQMACEVDVLGRVIVYTGNKEYAEHKRDMIINYGPDWRIDTCYTSMNAQVVLAQNDVDLQ